MREIATARVVGMLKAASTTAVVTAQTRQGITPSNARVLVLLSATVKCVVTMVAAEVVVHGLPMRPARIMVSARHPAPRHVPDWNAAEMDVAGAAVPVMRTRAAMPVNVWRCAPPTVRVRPAVMMVVVPAVGAAPLMSNAAMPVNANPCVPPHVRAKFVVTTAAAGPVANAVPKKPAMIWDNVYPIARLFVVIRFVATTVVEEVVVHVRREPTAIPTVFALPSVRPTATAKSVATMVAAVTAAPVTPV